MIHNATIKVESDSKTVFESLKENLNILVVGQTHYDQSLLLLTKQLNQKVETLQKILDNIKKDSNRASFVKLRKKSISVVTRKKSVSNRRKSDSKLPNLILRKMSQPGI